MMTDASVSKLAPTPTDDLEDETGLWPSDEDLRPWPVVPAEIFEASVLTFAEEGEEVFKTTCGEIATAYGVACAWKRLPAPPAAWEADLPEHLRLVAHDLDGELLTDFSARKEVVARDQGFAWFCGVETNPDDAPCEVCGSELFLLFQDAGGTAHRLERLTLLTAMLYLSELGHIPKLPNEIYRSLELEYDHICHSEHVLLGLGRGEPGHV